MRILLALSLLANALLGVGLYRYTEDYNRLLAWSCDNGNGGHECGED